MVSMGSRLRIIARATGFLFHEDPRAFLWEGPPLAAQSTHRCVRGHRARHPEFPVQFEPKGLPATPVNEKGMAPPGARCCLLPPGVPRSADVLRQWLYSSSHRASRVAWSAGGQGPHSRPEGVSIYWCRPRLAIRENPVQFGGPEPSRVRHLVQEGSPRGWWWPVRGLELVFAGAPVAHARPSGPRDEKPHLSHDGVDPVLVRSADRQVADEVTAERQSELFGGDRDAAAMGGEEQAQDVERRTSALQHTQPMAR